MSYLGMALRELSIRGDFRTTVEYLTHLIETDTFRQNAFSTNWLDSLIAAHDRPDAPDTRISAICAAIHIADRQWATVRQQYLVALEKGQVLPPGNLPDKQISVPLIYQNQLLNLLVSRPSRCEYCIKLGSK